MFPNKHNTFIDEIIDFIVSVIGGTSLIFLIDILMNKVFVGKKTVLFGPQSSGKTTFLRYIYKGEIVEGRSGAPNHYEVKDAIYDVVTDFGGGEEWLPELFEKYIKEHHYILFFFSVYEFINDIAYRNDCFARIDFIYNVIEKERSSNSEGQKKVLIIGTFIDKVPGFNSSMVENLFAGKPYAVLLQRSVYINTTQKECLKVINDALTN